jgi:hypothetical protein
MSTCSSLHGNKIRWISSIFDILLASQIKPALSAQQCFILILVFPLQYDAFDIGFITTDDFTNADILEVTYPTVAKRLNGDWMDEPAIPIVTGFLGKVCSST